MTKQTNLSSLKSEEEKIFNWYLSELKDKGYILNYNYESNTYDLGDKIELNWNQQLKTKTKSVTSHLLYSCEYTPDFIIEWAPKAEGIFYMKEGGTYKERCYFVANAGKPDFSIVDVKGTFKSAVQSTAMTFPDRQKWMYYRHRLYVQKVMPLHKKSSPFAKTFTPEKFLLTKTGKERKIHWDVKSLDDFLN